MVKVAFVNLEPTEKKFFETHLAGEQFELEFYREDEWVKIDPATEVLSVFVNFEVTRDVMDKLPNLKLIVCRSTGFDNIDMAAANEHGIKVANTPGYGSSSVAEYTFGLILMLSRKLPTILAKTNSDSVDRIAERGWDLNGKTIGIIGLGSIGRGVAQIAHGFGMKILAVDRGRIDDFAQEYSVEYTDDMSRICREADIVTLHVPYTPDNHHLIGAKVLSEMKNTALVINTARGELVNTLQLARMLKDGKLGGVALDVIEDEDYLFSPNALIDLASGGDQMAIDKLRHALAVSALERMSNVIITNHNAFNTIEALERINSTAAQNIVNFYSGGDVDYVS